MNSEKRDAMTTAKISRCFACGLVILFLGLSSCAPWKAGKAAPAAPVAAGTEEVDSADAATDQATGVLGAGGTTEAEKELAALESEADAEMALQELRRRQEEEERQRAHRTITDDAIVQRQTE